MYKYNMFVCVCDENPIIPSSVEDFSFLLSMSGALFLVVFYYISALST